MNQIKPPNGSLPGPDAVLAVCQVFGVDPVGAQLLHARSNAVYLLPRERIVGRLAPDTPLRRRRAHAAITVTRWLADQPEPVALPPVPGHQPVIASGTVATFWPYRAITPPPALADLAVLLRRLHVLPTPPFPLPGYVPLQRLREALQLDQRRPQPALSGGDHLWLSQRASELTNWFRRTDFPLGQGLIHSDASSENMVHTDDHDGWLLIDWDGTCLGPRELDLLSGIPNHFQEPEADRQQFLATYGYDILDWPSWPLLRDLTELHSLSAYIRLAPSKPAAATELRHRVRSLRSGDQTAVWHAIR